MCTFLVKSQRAPVLFTESQTTVSAPVCPAPASAAMTELEKCIESTVLVFQKYAEKDGDKRTLTKKELKSLVKNELPSFPEAQKNPTIAEFILSMVDGNEDDMLAFEEFHSFVVRLSQSWERFYLISANASAAISELEKSMQSLLSIYNKYAVEEERDEYGNMQTMTKKELKKLLETELPSFLENPRAPEVVNKILKDLDANKDDKLHFGEFAAITVGISVNCEKLYSLLGAETAEKMNARMANI